MFHTPSSPISTGRFLSKGAVRKCSSMSCAPVQEDVFHMFVIESVASMLAFLHR